MRNSSPILAALLAVVFSICVAHAAEEPIKWSAPMQAYPNQWSPTAPPAPYYYYPPGYSGGVFGYGTYGGSWGYSGQYQRPYGYPQQGFSGNPYHSYYYNR